MKKCPLCKKVYDNDTLQVCTVDHCKLIDATVTNIPRCPICNSDNLSRITVAHKAGKIALFGIFGMGDNGKTWKCNNCGSKF